MSSNPACRIPKLHPGVSALPGKVPAVWGARMGRERKRERAGEREESEVIHPGRRETQAKREGLSSSGGRRRRGCAAERERERASMFREGAHALLLLTN